MSTLVLTAARSAGSALVRTAGQIALSQASSAIGSLFDNRTFEGPRLDSFHLQTSRDGAPMARVYGRMRLAGQVIWASRLKEHITEERVGGKGGPKQREFSYTISFAIGLCEGGILGVDRIWVNGTVMQAGPVMRIYKGSEDQLPDPVINAIDGPDAPAFRSTAYLVFEDFPLDEYGARLPQFNVEVIRVVGDEKLKLESLVTGVNLLPSSGEFAYATDVVEEAGNPGSATPINLNNLSGQADIEKALDQLETQLPNCKNVSIIVSWFGTSTDCAVCEIKPGVETRDRITPDAVWSVAGETRGTAYLVGQTNGRSNYGGSPSDESILQTLASLKGRGFKVSIYPFILMDTDGFPWRGRITGVASDVDTFFARDWGFEKFILHYAGLAAEAGGVDRFIMGSEMRGMTTVNEAGNYPFVDRLIGLAGSVKAILPNAELTYAADWSEYFGHHEGGNVTFHLDPLWSSPNIDAVGIDAYFPLSDWRDGDHLDSELADDIYNLSYLKSQMEGGEGYDYYYATPEDRDAQIRTPITDWVYRYKDIRNWWSNNHQNSSNREVTTTTDWVPESKPIWFTEIGCPAVDKGANQPNVFYDPKSVESFFPYYSNGSRDDLIQRRYIEAFHEYWADEPMVDMSASHVWCWDARPYPDFPARSAVWADGSNWERGHWLTGRVGLMPLADVVRDLSEKSGLIDVDVSKLTGLVEGFVIDRPMTTRAALTPLSLIYGFSLTERASGLLFVSNGLEAQVNLSSHDMTEKIEQIKDDSADHLKDVRVHYIDAGRDYQLGTESVRDQQVETVQVLDINAPIVMNPALARSVSERVLTRTHIGDQSLDFSLAPARLDVEVGDVIAVDGVDGTWRIEALDGLNIKDLTARRVDNLSPLPNIASTPVVTTPIPFVPKPFLFALDIPGERNGPLIGAVAAPFNPVTITGPDGEAVIEQPAAMGALLTDLPAGPIGRWDRANQFDISIAGIDLASVNDATILKGANRFAVEQDDEWENIQARDIELIGNNAYRLGTLLRGQNGTKIGDISVGARIVWLGRGLADLPISNARLGETIFVTGEAAGRDSDPLEFSYKAIHLRPLVPVHGKITNDDTNLTISWIRQARIGGDNWAAMDVPLGEVNEFYNVGIFRNEIGVSTFEVTEAEITLPVSNLETGDEIHIRQGSQAYGYGLPLIFEISL